MSDESKTLVLGIGTGRSGTLSITKTLDALEGAEFSHELAAIDDNGRVQAPAFPPLPWIPDLARLDTALEWIFRRNARVVGDVAHFWLPYVPLIIERFSPQVRVFALKRPKQEVVRSFRRKAGRKNHWMDHRGVLWKKSHDRDASFPHYSVRTRRAALGLYWDEYDRRIDELVALFPGFVGSWSLEEVLVARTELPSLLEYLGVAPVGASAGETQHANRSQSLARVYLRELARRVFE